MNVIRFIWDLVRIRPWLYTINLIVWIVIQSLPIFPGLVIKEYFEVLSTDEISSHSPWFWLTILFSLTVARIVFVFIGNITDTNNRYSVSYLLRKNVLFNTLNNVSLGREANKSLTYFRDDVDIIEDAFSWTLDLIGKTVFAIISISILFTINPQVVMFVFIPLILIVIFIQRLTKLLNTYRQRSRESTEVVVGHMNELLNNYETFNYANRVDESLENLKAKQNDRKKWMVKDGVLTEALNSTNFNTVNIGTGIILLILIYQNVDQSFNLGDFALFVYYLTFVSDFTMFFGKFLTQYKQTNVSYERLLKFAQVEHKNLVGKKMHLKKPEYSELKSDIIFENLTFSYNETKAGITNITFKVPKNNLTIIKGPIGSGKTTLLKAIVGILPLETGNVRWNGSEVNFSDQFWPPQQVSYVPQKSWIFNGTIKENITMLEEVDSKNLHNVMQLSLMTKNDEEFNKERLESRLKVSGADLSGGQKSRITIARSLLKNPQILIIDDIFNSLDLDTQNELWRNLLSLNKTIVAVTTNKYALEQADQILTLKNGRLIDEH